MGTKSNFPWRFLWDFTLTVFACIIAIAQACYGSAFSALAFAFIAYILYKLMIIDDNDD